MQVLCYWLGCGIQERGGGGGRTWYPHSRISWNVNEAKWQLKWLKVTNMVPKATLAGTFHSIGIPTLKDPMRSFGFIVKAKDDWKTGKKKSDRRGIWNEHQAQAFIATNDSWVLRTLYPPMWPFLQPPVFLSLFMSFFLILRKDSFSYCTVELISSSTHFYLSYRFFKRHPLKMSFYSDTSFCLKKIKEV